MFKGCHTFYSPPLQVAAGQIKFVWLNFVSTSLKVDIRLVPSLVVFLLELPNNQATHWFVLLLTKLRRKQNIYFCDGKQCFVL